MILRVLWQSAALLLLAAAAAWATWQWHPERPELHIISERAGPDEITVADAIALEKAKGVIWLDARRRPEFEKGHIPGSRKGDSGLARITGLSDSQLTGIWA